MTLEWYWLLIAAGISALVVLSYQLGRATEQQRAINEAKRRERALRRHYGRRQ